MEIYAILAFSFALMFWWNYTREIIKTVQDVENMFDDVDERLKPVTYTIRMFFLTLFLAPWYLGAIATSSRWDYIKLKSTNIIRRQYDLPTPVKD